MVITKAAVFMKTDMPFIILAAMLGIYAAWYVARIKVQGVTLGDNSDYNPINNIIDVSVSDTY